MLGWFRGNPGEEGSNENNMNIDDDMAFAPETDYDPTMPPTPGPATFAYQALRYGILGTPKPSNPAPVYTREEHSQRTAEERDQEVRRDLRAVKSTSSRSYKPTERKLDFENGTPLKKSNGPQGILLTPGTTLHRKKSVTFGPNDYEDGSALEENGVPRIRSGIPADCPGKFPSPWTPKIVSPSKRRSLSGASAIRPPVDVYDDSDQSRDEQESKPRKRIERQSPRKPTKTSTFALELNSEAKSEDLQSTVKSQLHVLKNNTAALNDIIISTDHADADITVNLDEPKSRSGKYWKTKYTSTIDGVEQRVEYYKTRKDTSVEFASKKDAQCSDLAVRLHEEIELRHKLQAEVDKWQKLAESRSSVTNNEGFSSFRLHEKLTRENLEYRELLRKKDKELRDVKLRADRQAKENEVYKQHVETLETEIKETNEQLESQRLKDPNTIDTKAANLQMTKSKFEQKEIESLKAKQESLQLDLEKSRKEIEKNRSTKDTLSEELKLARDENRRLQRASTKGDLVDMDYVYEIADLKKQLKDASTQSWNMDKAHQAEVNQLKAEIQECRDELALLKAENISLKMDLSNLVPVTKSDKHNLVQHSPIPLPDKHKPAPEVDSPVPNYIIEALAAEIPETPLALPRKSNPQQISGPSQARQPDSLDLQARLNQIMSSPRKTPAPQWKDDDIPDLPPLSPSYQDTSDDSACDNSYDRVALNAFRPSKKDEDEYSPVFTPLPIKSKAQDKSKPMAFKPTTIVSPVRARAFSNLTNKPSFERDRPSLKPSTEDLSIKVANSAKVRPLPASPARARAVSSSLRSRITAPPENSPRPKIVLLENPSEDKPPVPASPPSQPNMYPDPKEYGITISKNGPFPPLKHKTSIIDDPARRAAAAARVAERRAKIQAEANKENLRSFR